MISPRAIRAGFKHDARALLRRLRGRGSDPEGYLLAFDATVPTSLSGHGPHESQSPKTKHRWARWR